MIYIILIIIVCVLFLLYLGFKRYILPKIKEKKITGKVKKSHLEKKQKSKVSVEIKQLNLKKKNEFMYRKEVLFWKFLNTILPKAYIVVPKVALSNLVDPDGDRSVYNNISNKSVDYVIFSSQTMNPVLLIDLYDKSNNERPLCEEDEYLFNALNKIDIPMLTITMTINFNKEQIKNDIYSKLGLNES